MTWMPLWSFLVMNLMTKPKRASSCCCRRGAALRHTLLAGAGYPPGSAWHGRCVGIFVTVSGVQWHYTRSRQDGTSGWDVMGRSLQNDISPTLKTTSNDIYVYTYIYIYLHGLWDRFFFYLIWENWVGQLGQPGTLFVNGPMQSFDGLADLLDQFLNSCKNNMLMW